MTEAEFESFVDQKASWQIKQELNYLLDDVEHEEPYNLASAWSDVKVRMDEKRFYPPAFVLDARCFAIALGEYRTISEAEMARTVVTSGSKYDFKLKGQFYVWDHHEPVIPDLPDDNSN